MFPRKFLLIFSLMFPVFAFGTAHAKRPARTCDVKVVKTLQAHIMRGMPHLEDILRTTKDRDAILRYAHSDYHLSCRFQVEVNGGTYLYYDESHASGNQDAQKECLGKYDAIRDQIVAVTQNCKDLEAPDRYGTTLHPFFP